VAAGGGKTAEADVLPDDRVPAPGGAIVRVNGPGCSRCITFAQNPSRYRFGVSRCRRVSRSICSQLSEGR